MNLGEGIGHQRQKGADTCDSRFAIAPGDDVELMLFVYSQLKDDLGTCHLKVVDCYSLHGTVYHGITPHVIRRQPCSLLGVELPNILWH